MTLLCFSCTTSPPWVSLNASRADQCGVGRNRTKGLTSAHRTSRGDTPSATRSRYLLTPTHTNTDTTQNIFSSCLYPLPLAYTHSRASLAVKSYSSLSCLDLPHFLCYLSHAPTGPSTNASLEYVIHTHISLGPAKYINYTFTYVTSHIPLI